MWEWKDLDGEIRTFKPNSNTKRCPICGQFFKKGEKGCIIIPPMEARTQHKKLQQNMIVHLDEWQTFCENITTEKELTQKFIKYRTPKKKDFTGEERKKNFCFQKCLCGISFLRRIRKTLWIKMQT